MYVHIGPSKAVRKEDIISVFDLDSSTVSVFTRSFLSKAEKEKYDEKALCCFVAKLLFAMAGFVLIIFCVENVVVHLSLSLLAVIFIFAAIIYANTGNRFKKK